MKAIKRIFIITFIMVLMLLLGKNTVYASENNINKESVNKNISLKTGKSIGVSVPYPADSYNIVNGEEPVLYISSDPNVAIAYNTGISFGSSGNYLSVDIIGKSIGTTKITILMKDTGEVLANYLVTVAKADAVELNWCPDKHTTISFEYTTNNFDYILSNPSVNMNIYKQSTSQWSINGNMKYMTTLEISFSTVGQSTIAVYDSNNVLIAEYDVTISEHNWNEGAIIKNATCKENGVKQYTCQRCGMQQDNTEDVPALGHEYSSEWTIDKKPSCTEKGSKSKHCIRCDEKSEITEIEEIPHAWEEEYTVEKKATCIETGIKSIHCSICGERKNEEIIDALGHDYGEWKLINAATCTEKGLEERKCIRCGNVEKKYINALGHSWETYYTTDKSPTCEDNGKESIHCSKCNTTKDIKNIPAKGHRIVIEKAVDATCLEKGLTEGRVCSVCGKVLKSQKEIPALGHQIVTIPSINANCTKKGQTEGKYCSRCGVILEKEREIPAKGHQLIVIKGYAATCSKAGKTDGKECSICGIVMQKQKTIAPAHKVKKWTITREATVLKTGLKIGKCSVCKKSLKQTIAKLPAMIKVSSKMSVKIKSSKVIKVKYGKGDGVKSYRSNNKKIVTVTKYGKITGKKKGKAIITVKLKSGKKANVTVVVI